MIPFVELHAHTEYSNTRLLDCLSKLDATIKHAATIGLQGVAITDHECLSGHIKALRTAQKVREAHPDFRLILGNEIYLCHDTEPSLDEKGKIRYSIESPDFFHFILLAKDAIGHEQLRLLSSRAWSRCYSYKRVERVPTFYSDVEEIVGPNPGHLVACTACLGGEFAKLTLAGNAEGAFNFASWCKKQFGDGNFYIELQPGKTEDQILFNQRAIKFCKYFDLPWVITNDVHYLSYDKRELHAIYLNSHDEEREAGDFYESTYFKTPDEMIERMPYLEPTDVEKGFENTIKIGEMCKDAGDYGLFRDTIVPEREIPSEPVIAGLLRDWYDTCPSIKYLATSPYVQDRFFLQQLEKGLTEKKIPVIEKVAKRIDIEAQQLIGLSEKVGNTRFTSYYNTMQLIEEIIWQVSIIGPGRGSACCWYCAYLMDITSVDSLEHDLPYWRHMHVSKVSWPDIDIDLLPSKRPQIFDMLKNHFGRDRCLNIITFRTESLKSAIKTACRGLSIDSDTAQELSGYVPITRGRVWTYAECLNGNEDNGFRPITTLVNKIAEYPRLHETIQEIEGIVSGRGQHASGFYLFTQPYYKQNSLMRTPSGEDVTCWEMADSDAAGAMKFDLLVTDAVEKIQKTMELLIKDGYIEWQGSLKATYDKYLHPTVIDYVTPEMWDHVGCGEIVDLFQFMSDVGIEAIRKIKPRSLDELSTASSIMRLMSDDGEAPIDRYVRFKNTNGAWVQEMQNAGLNADEMSVLHKHLDASCGSSVVQETLMELMMDPQIANFDMSEADLARKIIGKKIREKIPMLKDMFFEHGRKLGTRDAMLTYVWDKCILCQLG